MKAQFIYSIEKGPNTDDERAAYHAAMKAGKPNPLGKWKVGDIIDHPDCHYLVKMGVCKPVDQECRERSGNLTDEQIADRLDTYRKLEAGKLTGDPNIDAPDVEDDDE